MQVKQAKQIFFIISCLVNVGLQAINTPYRFNVDTYKDERRGALSFDKGAVLCTMASCSFGADASILVPVFRAVSNCFNKSGSEQKQFVQTYSRWNKNQFESEALQRFTHSHEDVFLSADMQNIILAEHHLYQFQGFQDLIKTFPAYEDYIKELHKKVSVDSRARNKWWKDFPGFKHQPFTDLLDTLYKRVLDAQKARQKHEHKKRESIQKEQQVAAQRERVAREEAVYEKVLSVVRNGPSLCLVNKQDREQAIQRTLQEGMQKLERQFECKAHACSFARQYGIKESAITDGVMDSYQYQLHTEFVDQLTAASILQWDYRHSERVNVFLDAVGHSVAQGIDASTNNQMEAATYWADVGWQALDLAQAMAEGVCLGVYNASAFIGNTVAHPIDTIVTTAHGIGNMAGLLARAVGTVIRLDHALEHHHQEYAVIVRDTVEHIDTLINHCAQSAQNMPTRDKVKNATAFVTEFFVTSKALQVAGAIGSRMRPLLVECLEVASAARKEQVGLAVAGVGENITFHAAEEGAAIGGGIKEIQKVPSGPKVVDKIRRTIEPTWIDVKKMREKFHGRVVIKGESVHIDYAHLCTIEEVSIVKRSGRVCEPRLSGWHHDYGRRLEKAGIVRYENVVELGNGAFEATPIINGVQYGKKSFFPPDWPEEKVMEEVYKAFEKKYFSNDYRIDWTGCYVVEGETECGIALDMIYNPNTKIIETSYTLKRKIV